MDQMKLVKHSKTGNTYTFIGEAKPSEYLEGVEGGFKLKAHCSENKDVSVSVKAFQHGELYFESKTRGLFEPNVPKVLYYRNGVFWLRSVWDFYLEVEIEGKKVGRFVDTEEGTGMEMKYSIDPAEHIDLFLLEILSNLPDKSKESVYIGMNNLDVGGLQKGVTLPSQSSFYIVNTSLEKVVEDNRVFFSPDNVVFEVVEPQYSKDVITNTDRTGLSGQTEHFLPVVKFVVQSNEEKETNGTKYTHIKVTQVL